MDKDKRLKEIDEAWLGLGYIDDSKLFIPTEFVKPNSDDFHLRLSYLMSKPEYFSFMCKEILNIQLLPMQCLFLMEMWKRKFPMLIASRGFGKALPPQEKVRVENGWKEIKDIEIGDKVYGSNGYLCNVTNATFLQKNLNMYRVTLRDGRKIECCEDHMWKVWDKNKNRDKDETIWSELKTKDMISNFYWNRTGEKSTGKEFRYALPINKPIQESSKEYEIHPYILGVILGDGCITQDRVVITNKDLEVIEKVKSLLPSGYKISKLKSKYSYSIIRDDTNLNSFISYFKELNLDGCNSKSKFIPNIYKYGSIEQRKELIKGLMDTDGYSNGQSVIEYYTISQRLSDDFLDVARSLGYSCRRSIKQSWFKGSRYNDCHIISIYTDQEVFSLPRKLQYLNHTISKQGQSKYEKTFITNIEYIGKGDGYCITVDNDDKTYITKDYIVTHNSFGLSLYAMIRGLILDGRKIVIVGSAFRQSKVLFEYMETIWRNAPILRSMCDDRSGPRRELDRCTMRINNSLITCLPLGDGQKIRGQRANDIIADEFASIPRDIFENVVAGFASVSSDPVGNVQREAADAKAKELGIIIEEEEQMTQSGQTIANQIILSGTAYYEFNHFAEYWKKWKNFIKSKGNTHLLSEYFENGEVPEAFDWSQYSIIRVPYELLPKGFMDADQVARSKATVHSGIYQMEFGAVFTRDSQGFFKRSLIEGCVPSPDNDIKDGKGNYIEFEPMLMGDTNKKYVFGVDPASENDNFSIVIMEINPDHRRIVHCWTTTRSEHKEFKKSGYSTETDFYSYCAKKIRDLMKRFPCVRIAMDAQGGGIAVMEALHDTDKINSEIGEEPIWPIIDEEKPADTDDEKGLHILEMCQFAKYDWLAEANHGLKKDFEDKKVIFPKYDGATLGLCITDDELRGRAYDTLEDCVLDIEELKNELSIIEISQTPSGKDKWDTPEVVVGVGKKSRLRKDRYSSLIMANMAARVMEREPGPLQYNFYGGFADGGSYEKKKDKKSKLYQAPSWFEDGMQGVY